MRRTKIKTVILMFICAIAALYASCVKKEIVYTEEDFVDAVGFNKIVIVKACLAQGMSVETPTYKGTVLNYALSFGRDEIAKLLIEHGADVNATQAIGNTRTPDMVQLLLEHGANPNIIVSDNLSLLMAHLQFKESTTSETGKQEYEKMLKTIELLLQYGADPNYYSEETGLTPLRVALNYELREAVDILLKYGAIPRSEAVPIDFLGDFNYNDPLNFREWDEDYGIVWQSDLLLFAYNGYTDLLMPYIESGEISPDDATPLGHDFYYYAVWGGHPETIMALLPYLDNINRRYNNGFYTNIPLLYLAGLHDHAEATAVLVENGANYRLTVLDKNGFEYKSSSIFKEHALTALIDFYEDRKRHPEYRVTKKVVQ